MMGAELDHVVRRERISTLHKGDDRATKGLLGETPMRQCISHGLSLEVAMPKNEVTLCRLSSICKKSVGFRPNDLSRMQLTLHANRRTHNGIGPATARRAPSRVCRDARSMI